MSVYRKYIVSGLLVCASFILIACGTSNATSIRTPASVRKAILTEVHAQYRGDGKTACSLMDARYQKDTISSAQGFWAISHHTQIANKSISVQKKLLSQAVPTCESAISELYKDLGLAHATKKDFAILNETFEKATIKFQADKAIASSSNSSFTLILHDNEWLLDTNSNF
jgi:hypothetical protein